MLYSYWDLFFFSNRQRMGESLNDLTLEELTGLEQDILDGLKIIRECKVIKPYTLCASSSTTVIVNVSNLL